MKTKISLRTGLTAGLLFAAALPSAALPGPDDYQKTADDVKKAAVTPTLMANPQTVQIPAGQNAASTNVSWNMGTGRPIIVLRVKVNGGGETDLQTLPSVPGPGFTSQPNGSLTVPVKPGTNVFTLNQAGQTLASVTVKGIPVKGEGDANQGLPPAKTHTSTSATTESAEAEESSSNDTDDQHGKHKKNKKKKKHHHHHDDDQDQGND